MHEIIYHYQYRMHVSYSLISSCNLWEWNFCYHLILLCWYIKNISHKKLNLDDEMTSLRSVTVICKKANYTKFNMLYKVIYKRNLVWCFYPEIIRGKGWGGVCRRKFFFSGKREGVYDPFSVTLLCKFYEWIFLTPLLDPHMCLLSEHLSVLTFSETIFIYSLVQIGGKVKSIGGSPGEVICQVAKDENAQLIVTVKLVPNFRA